MSKKRESFERLPYRNGVGIVVLNNENKIFELIGIIWKGRFKGQIQKWFIMRFIGNESEINISTKKPEFLEWKWIDLKDLTKIAVNFKLNVYKSLKQEISKVLN